MDTNDKRRKSDGIHHPAKGRKYHLGQTLVGMRVGSKAHAFVGVLVEQYYTDNDGWHNYAYVLENEQGVRRSFQFVKLTSEYLTVSE
jgi:hypothetical protein